MSNLTTFQKMSEMDKKLFVCRLINLCSADEKAFTTFNYQMTLQEERLKLLHIPIATNFASITIP